MGVYKTGYIEKGAKQEDVVEILGGLLHNLNEILNRLSSDNIKSIDTGRTAIKSGDGSTQFSGSQLIMRDSAGVERFIVGRRGDAFTFELKNVYGNTTMGLDSEGNVIIY